MASATQRPASDTNGDSVTATILVENPATGEQLTTVPILGSDELDVLVARAREAQLGWEGVGFAGRAKVLRRAQKWMLDNADRVIGVVVSESGKTHEDAQLADLGYTVTALGFWAKEAPKYLADERVPSWNNPTAAGKKLVIRYAPIGLVGVIGPWNYPIANSFGDCIPALAAGNTVILKPSEVTPLSSLLMEEMMLECGAPEGVFQVATGDGSTGAALISKVDCVMFTGSAKTGKKALRAAASAMIPCYLELGGKDPMIVCADADLERAANAAAFYSMNNAGQVCISIERCLRRGADLRQVRPGGSPTTSVACARVRPPGSAPSTSARSSFPPQLETVDSHVRDAVAKGATVVTGGHPGSGPGRFYEPTVLVDVDHSMKIMREETFGPTLPIMKIANAEEGVRLANDSSYGLQASVWTSDVERGEQLARRIEAGAVCVNDAQMNYSALNLPMGGWKASGLGTRHGAQGIRKYTKTQSLFVTKRALKREPFMFPYTAGRTKMLRKFLSAMYGRGSRD